jgi:hypothetical protein
VESLLYLSVQQQASEAQAQEEEVVVPEAEHQEEVPMRHLLLELGVP